MQAVRDRDVAAEVVGVSLGPLQGRRLRGVERPGRGGRRASTAPTSSSSARTSSERSFLSIQYIAIIIIGGVGTIFGSVLGALFLGGLPGAHRAATATSIPGVATSAGDDGFIERRLVQPGSSAC